MFSLRPQHRIRAQNLLAADLFVPGPPTFDDAALFQDIFGLALPPPTREGCPIFLGGMLPDASPGQAIERNAYLLPPVPEVSIIPQAVIMPTSNITRDYHPSYQRATGAELVLTGGFRSPVAVPTVALVRRSAQLLLLKISSFYNKAISIFLLCRNLSS